MDHRYDDLLHLPHHGSNRHPHMSMAERAAQFAPFAALRGYGEQVEATARTVAHRPERSEEQMAELNRRLTACMAETGGAAGNSRTSDDDRETKNLADSGGREGENADSGRGNTHLREPEVRLTVFIPDARKEGGTEKTITARLRRIDPVQRVIVLADRSRISFDSLLWLERAETADETD